MLPLFIVILLVLLVFVLFVEINSFNSRSSVRVYGEGVFGDDNTVKYGDGLFGGSIEDEVLIL